MHTDLQTKRCTSCEGIGRPLDLDQITVLKTQLHAGWQVNATHTAIERKLAFHNFYETMAFVNALAWMAHQENHHPDITTGYNYCHVVYTTHALQGLSMNDFICAAKMDALLQA